MTARSLWFAAFFATAGGFEAGVAAAAQKVLRVHNDFNLPLDPSQLTTMSEYNLSLCLFRTIFELDDASTPVSKVLSSWRYDEADTSYELSIRDGVKWSDGKSLTADDLAFSLLRLKIAAPGHFESIASLLPGQVKVTDQGVAHESLVVSGASKLRVKVHKAGPDLFKRLTAAFIPIVRRDQVSPKTGRIVRNTPSLGPYIPIESDSKPDLLVLEANPSFYDKRRDMPKRIEMKPNAPGLPDLKLLGTPKSWANVALDRAFLPTEVWNPLQKSGASRWTRSVDRAIFMYPTDKGMASRDLPPLMRWLGYALMKSPLDFSGHVGVMPARSLQPPGFPLNKDLEYPQTSMPRQDSPVKNAIVGMQIPRSVIEKKLAETGLSFEIVAQVPASKRFELEASTHVDVFISNVGAADPDPTTWLTLILDEKKPFIEDSDGLLRRKFSLMKAMRDARAQTASLIELVHDAGREGRYVPLAHYSSVAIATGGFSLKNIRPIDETVDLSKVVVEDVR
jgi:MarR-like DNA-binding transcriptional regulator SgrR of sgrS sRNA